MKKFKFTSLLASLLLLVGCNTPGGTTQNGGANIVDYETNKQPGNDPFNYPGNYIEPELKVDGLQNEKEWETASPVVKYGLRNQASMQLYRGSTALYAFFHVDDQDIQTVGNSNGDDVTHSDSIEIYFDFQNDGASKPQTDDIQINISANGRTRIFVGTGDGWGTWNGLLDFELNIDGTLNTEIPDTSLDNGYSVEIMIPYTQVGIEKDSVFGVALGVVSRGLDSTSETLDYTWQGIDMNGAFVDPQKPSGYFVYMGNEFFAKDKVPMENIVVEGYVYNQKKEAVKDAVVEIGGQTAKTNQAGKYTIFNVSPNESQTLSITKEGFKPYETTLKADLLREAVAGKYSKDVAIIDESITFKTTLTGVVKNPANGVMADATVKIGETTLTTNAEGKFTHEVVVDGDIDITLSKVTYKDSVSVIEALTLAGNANYDLGDMALYSPSSSFSFGGQRGVTLVHGEVYRGFEGINFKFSSDKNIINGDKIELFIDTGASTFARDTSDYRIDFDGDGTIYIVNFGDGSNVSIAKSGIKNNAYLQGSTYYVEAFIPYAFLGVEYNEVIGFSCGSYKASPTDWDGFTFPQEGFADYVAPEIPTEYLRVGLDNGLYRAISNEIIAKKVYGTVKDSNGNVLTNAYVNGTIVDGNGFYSVYVLEEGTVSFTVTCNGYLNQTVTVDMSNSNEVNKDIVMVQSLAQVQVTVKDANGNAVTGATITVKQYADVIGTTDANGVCVITVPSGQNINVTVSKDGYAQQTFIVAKVALATSANNDKPFEKTITLKLA